MVDKGEDKVSDLDDKKRTEHHVVEAWINADSKAYLREVGSSLYDRADSMDFTERCRDMNIVDGPPEYTKPRNVGLLFFSMDPTSTTAEASATLGVARSTVSRDISELKLVGRLAREGPAKGGSWIVS